MAYEEKYNELVELSDSEIEEYNRKLRPDLYAELDKKKDSKDLNI